MRPMFHTTCLHRNSMNLSASTRDYLCGGMLVLGVLSWKAPLRLVLITTGGGGKGVTCARLGDPDKLLLGFSWVRVLCGHA